MEYMSPVNKAQEIVWFWRKQKQMSLQPLGKFMHQASLYLI